MRFGSLQHVPQLISKIRIYELPWNAAVYLLAVLALVWDVVADTYVPLFIMGALFLTWDLEYVLNTKALTGRDPRRIDDLTTIGRTYMSWYMLFSVCSLACCLLNNQIPNMGSGLCLNLP